MGLARSAVLAALLLAALAGCKPKVVGWTPDGAPNAPPPPKCDGCTPVAPANVPHLKAGYWQSSSTSSTGATSSRPWCTHGASIGPRMGPEGLGQGCTFSGVQQSPAGAYVYDVICLGNGATSDGHTSYRGDFISHYTIDSIQTDTQAGEAPHVTTGHTESHYLGDCPAGTRAED